MKIRRLDREYQEVLKAEIKTDPEDFKGLASILAADRAENEAEGEDSLEEEKEQMENREEDDGFGDFVEASTAAAG